MLLQQSVRNQRHGGGGRRRDSNRRERHTKREVHRRKVYDAMAISLSENVKDDGIDTYVDDPIL